MVFGSRRSAVPTAAETGRAEPRETLEALVLPALRRTPCVVAFSGGRDSSAVLATAAAIARKHGLDAPIPVTLRFGGDLRAEEERWQELTVRHLGLGEWLRLDLTTELDALGPIGSALLDRHGEYWPPLAHSTAPMLAAAERGSLLTGNGGDEFLSPWDLRRIWLLRHGRAIPRRADAKQLVLFSMPRRVRGEIWRRRAPLRLGWLTPEADRELQRLWATQATTRDGSWSSYVESVLDSRYFELGRAVFAALAADAGVLLVEPFLEPAFARAVARVVPLTGFVSRNEALERLFGDLLPPETIARKTKATFTTVPWGPAARSFAAEWDGSGLGRDLVEVEALRAEWLSERPDFRSLTSLQCAWLATRSR